MIRIKVNIDIFRNFFFFKFLFQSYYSKCNVAKSGEREGLGGGEVGSEKYRINLKPEVTGSFGTTRESDTIETIMMKSMIELMNN